MDQEVMGGKYFPIELGVNVPLLVQWPGQVKAGTTCDSIVDFTDIFPTLCDLAGVELPSEYPLDGGRLVPFLHGKSFSHKEYTFTWGNFENNSSKYKDPSHNTDKLLDVIRGPRFKLYSDGRLYDIQNDFLELALIEPGFSKESDQARFDLQASLEKLKQTKPRAW